MSGARHVVAGSRWKVVLVLGICAMFVALGWFMVTQGAWFGWVVAGFFGPGGLVVVAMLLLRGWPSIVLDENGFEFTASFSRRSRLAWSDVLGFFVMRMYGSRMIGIAFAPDAPMRGARRFARAISGVEGAIPDQYALSPEELCTLLNQWRERHAAAREPQ